MFDLSLYNLLKSKGLINKVQKTNTNSEDALTYAVYIKNYKLDGAEVIQEADTVESVAAKELAERRAQVIADSKAEVASIDAFIADAVNGV